jgi:hypothetical protein
MPMNRALSIPVIGRRSHGRSRNVPTGVARDAASNVIVPASVSMIGALC